MRLVSLQLKTTLTQLFSFAFLKVMLPSVPRVPFFLIAVALVSVAISNAAIVMRLFQARHCFFFLVNFLLVN